MSAQLLRTYVIESALVSLSFMTRRAFRVAKELPWRLARGDLEENIKALAAQEEEPPEETAATIWRLAKLGFNRKDLVDGLKLLGQTRWSSMTVEQPHGSTAAIHKQHGGYATETLSRRAFVHMLRALLPSSPDDAQVIKIRKKIAALERLQLQKMGGRQLFLGEFLETLKAQRPTMSIHALRDLAMRQHGHVFDCLPSAARRRYAVEAARRSELKKMDIAESIKHFKTMLFLKAARGEVEGAEKSHLLHVSNAKFSCAELQAFGEVWNSGGYTARDTRKLLRQYLVPPEVPSAEIRADLERRSCHAPLGAPCSTPQPWAKVIADFRKFFSGCIVAFGELGSGLESCSLSKSQLLSRWSRLTWCPGQCP